MSEWKSKRGRRTVREKVNESVNNMSLYVQSLFEIMEERQVSCRLQAPIQTTLKKAQSKLHIKKKKEKEQKKEQIGEKSNDY